MTLTVPESTLVTSARVSSGVSTTPPRIIAHRRPVEHRARGKIEDCGVARDGVNAHRETAVGGDGHVQAAVGFNVRPVGTLASACASTPSRLNSNHVLKVEKREHGHAVLDRGNWP